MRSVDKFTLWFGITNLIVGILSIFTPFVGHRSARNPIRRIKGERQGVINREPGMLLGRISAVNPPHAILHAVLGALGLAASGSNRFTRGYLWLNGLVFAVLAAVGWAAVGIKPGVHNVRGVAFDRQGNAIKTLWAAIAMFLALRGKDADQSPIPREKTLDSSLALLMEGYTFISRRCARYKSDVFQTRITFRKVFCMQGEEAARVFYSGDRFTRRNALPAVSLRLLQGFGSFFLLDGEAHRQRKRPVIALMAPENRQRFNDILTEEWRNAARRWEKREKIVFYHEVEEIIFRTVCRWAGVPVPEGEVAQRTSEVAVMFEGAGAVGWRNLQAQILRTRTENWIEDVVEMVRAGAHRPGEDSAAQVLALAKDAQGNLLDKHVAAVELINILRPTVAVARFITYAALALHDYPEVRRRLESGDEEYLDWFVHEVRRYYPFFPFVAGRVRQPFHWRGLHFKKNTWVMLDLFGTNHDERSWDNPDKFRPERFKDWNGSAYNYIPQGGGDTATDHRCPGEDLTLDMMKQAVRMLTKEMRYDVPEQNLNISLRKMPSIPKSRFIMRNVRLVNRAWEQERMTV
jgi:fatty-acid peroxygenase